MNGNKRKRSAKTSAEQYDEYLRLMEEDEIFRKGTINPSINPDYINECWKKLQIRLNASDIGPSLSASEWKKRFNDWKNSTRAKYRKITQGRKVTVGGSLSATPLNSLEHRGISVWGCEAVTGTPNVLLCGGSQEKEKNINIVEPEPQIIQIKEKGIENSETGEKLINLDVILQPASPTQQQHIFEANPQKRPAVAVQFSNKESKNKRDRSVKSIGEELLNLYKKHSEAIEKKSIELEERKLRLEEKRLNFEIQKFQFENPTFIFKNIDHNI